MSERYWITGVQLGMLLAFQKTRMPNRANELIEEIIDKQFIGDKEDLDKLLEGESRK